MAACGQTSAHLPHWMQIAGSQTGISSAMLRFSHWVVPVGQVPSTGKAETGRLVAVAGDDLGGDVLDERRRLGRARRGGMLDLAGDLVRVLDLVQVRQGVIHGREVLLHHGLAAPAVGLLDRLP